MGKAGGWIRTAQTHKSSETVLLGWPVRKGGTNLAIFSSGEIINDIYLSVYGQLKGLQDSCTLSILSWALKNNCSYDPISTPIR